jgi:hypothetical protein
MEKSKTIDRSQHATRISDVLLAVATRRFDLVIDDVTAERWSQLFMLMREVDTLADTMSSESLLEELVDFSHFALRYPLLSPSSLGETFEQFVSQTELVLSYGQDLAQSSNDEDYIDIRQREAYATAEILRITASSELQSEDRFDDFMQLTSTLALAGGFIDTAQDAKRDYNDNILQFAPTLRFRIKLGALGVRAMMKARHDLLDPAMLPTYAKYGATAIRSHHIRNQAIRRTNRL